MRIIAIFFFVFYPSYVFAQAQPSFPNYGAASPVPRAFAQTLMNRGFSASQVYNTMNGIASVAANDNALIAAEAASAGAMVGTRGLTWLAMGARLGAYGLAAGAAIQLGVEGYNWYYGDTNAGVGTAKGTEGKPIFAEFSYPNDDGGAQKTLTDYGSDSVVAYWQSEHFTCPGNKPYDCAIAEGKIDLWTRIEGDVKKRNLAVEDILQSYTANCSHSDAGSTSCDLSANICTVDTSGEKLCGSSIVGRGRATAVIRKSADKDKPAEDPACKTIDYAYIYGEPDPNSSHCGGDPSAARVPSTIDYPLIEVPYYTPKEIQNEIVRPEIPARDFNDLWQRASNSPNYQGVPYPMNDPVTPQEMQPRRLTIGDMVQPLVAPNATQIAWAPSVNPWPQGNPNSSDWKAPAPGTEPQATYWPAPAASSSPGSNPSPGSTSPIVSPGSGTAPSNGSSGDGKGSQSDPDPGVQKTADPQVPTIDQILRPIFSLRDKASNLRIDLSRGECPQIRFSVNFMQDQSREFSTSVHCDAAEKIRQPLSAIFIVIYAICALFVVLTA